MRLKNGTYSVWRDRSFRNIPLDNCVRLLYDKDLQVKTIVVCAISIYIEMKNTSITQMLHNDYDFNIHHFCEN